MNDLRIKTVLGISPRKKSHELMKVIRGASAKIDYILSDKWFGYENLEQLTFTFKQKKRVLWFNLFRYLRLTTDTTINESKVYYTNVVPKQDSRECTAELVKVPVENPAEAGYYELTEPDSGENDLYYLFDDHFYHIIQDGCEYISFIMTPAETVQFKPTTKSVPVSFEVAIRFNTDSLEEIAYKDSVIIDQQLPIMIEDSLYSQINTGDTVSIDPDMTVSVDRIVW